MRLLIDIGNTRIKWAYFDQGELRDADAVTHDDFSSNLLASWLVPEEVWVCSVGPKKILSAIRKQVKSRFDLTVNQVSVTKQLCGVQNDYKALSNLGVDRWVAAIGARLVVPKGDVVIIDVGTAVTIDWLSQQNVFEGGVILPGLRLMHDSLVGQTEGIVSDLLDTTQIIGKDTKECVNSGVSYGVVGAIERIVFEMQQHIDSSSNQQAPGHVAKVILTGGGRLIVLENSRLECIDSPNLVLLGLAQIAEEG